MSASVLGWARGESLPALCMPRVAWPACGSGGLCLAPRAPPGCQAWSPQEEEDLGETTEDRTGGLEQLMAGEKPDHAQGRLGSPPGGGDDDGEGAGGNWGLGQGAEGQAGAKSWYWRVNLGHGSQSSRLKGGSDLG